MERLSPREREQAAGPNGSAASNAEQHRTPVPKEVTNIRTANKSPNKMLEKRQRRKRWELYWRRPNLRQNNAGDFDWSRDDDGVVLREHYATAIYHNPNGELVIRQKRWPDDDQCIFIAPEALDTFIDKLTDIIGIPAGGRP